MVEGVVIGSLGELHPRWKQVWNLARSPVMFELDMDAVLQRTVPSAFPVPKFQAVERDLAVVVAERVTHADVMAAVWSASGDDVLRDAVLFDIYRSHNPPDNLQASTADKATSTSLGQLEPGSKSLAIRLTLNSDDGTLNEQQIDATVDKVVNRLAQAVGARLRT
jgi:phenylalanyl-tRNA synthetase beta chain